MPEDFAVSLLPQIRSVCGALLSKALHTQGNFPEVPWPPHSILVPVLLCWVLCEGLILEIS